VVGEHDLDLEPLGGGAVVLDRHARGHHRALAGEVGVEARLVVEDADLDDAVGDAAGLGDGEARPEQAGDGRGHEAGGETA
jgi:hypothetical protein